MHSDITTSKLLRRGWTRLTKKKLTRFGRQVSNTLFAVALSITLRHLFAILFQAIFELSNGSMFFTKAKENDAKLDIRIEALKQKLSRWRAHRASRPTAADIGIPYCILFIILKSYRNIVIDMQLPLCATCRIIIFSV